MGENPKTPLDDAEGFPAPVQATGSDAAHAGETPAATATTLQATAAADEGKLPSSAPAGRDPSLNPEAWPMYALVLFLAVAAFLAGIALYFSSRRGEDQTAAIEKFQQSLGRMEQQIALQSSAAKGASGPVSGAPATSDLLDAANAHYREGRFQEAAISFRAAAAADTGGQLSDEAHYRYGASLLKTGDSNGALREFQAVVTGSPGSPHFAASAIETARLLAEKQNYAQALRTLYQLLAARDRLSVADKEYVERACFLVGTYLESEAGALEAAQSATLPVARFGPADAELHGVGASGNGSAAAPLSGSAAAPLIGK